MLEVAAYNYGNDNINAVKNTPEDFFDLTIAELIEAGYLTSESDTGNFLINPVTGLSMTETVTITYADYRVKVAINGESSGLVLIVLTDGGTWSGTSPVTLASGGTLTIENPTKDNYNFTGWTISGEGSSIDGTTFTMGSESTVITANWSIKTYTLTVNANSGVWSGTTPQTLNRDDEVTIANPSRDGYLFTGWTLTGTGSTLVGTLFTMGTANATLVANWLAYTEMFTYTGSYLLINDGSGNWRIKFLTDGTFTPLINMTIDVFLVGGGGGGGTSTGNGAKGGGAGGHTTTGLSVSVTANTAYPIVIGGGGGIQAGGGTSTGFGYNAPGGGANNSVNGGTGGSGGGGASGYNTSYPYAGYGGSNGADGGSGAGDSTAGAGGAGQGSTTREFGESTGALYGAGGSGGVHNYGTAAWVRSGGETGGGTGGAPNNNGGSGAANTGGGGGGGAGYMKAGGYGGSGIVIIRNHR
jgi:uncharacterized repeat protein (TIGR02543 family)